MFLTMGYGVYFFFASLMICSVVFVYFLIPETKTIPLEAMDQLFAIKPVSKANEIVLERLQSNNHIQSENTSEHIVIGSKASHSQEKEFAKNV